MSLFWGTHSKAPYSTLKRRQFRTGRVSPAKGHTENIPGFMSHVGPRDVVFFVSLPLCKNVKIVLSPGVAHTQAWGWPIGCTQWHPAFYLETFLYINECWAKWSPVLLTSYGVFQSKHLFLAHTWGSEGKTKFVPWSFCSQPLAFFLPKSQTLFSFE